MEGKYSVLIVDDHPFVCEAYKSILNEFRDESISKYQIKFAHNCKDAYKTILESKKYEKENDIIFLDIRIPAYPEKSILSGEDLGIFIRQVSPNTKILVLTSTTSNYRLRNLITSVNPEGLLIKSDTTNDDLINAIEAIKNNKTFYSCSIQKLFRAQSLNNFYLDEIDRTLLYYLSKGFTTKELRNHLPLSLSGIEKRKRNLFLAFELKNPTSSQLVKAAYSNGYL